LVEFGKEFSNSIAPQNEGNSESSEIRRCPERKRDKFYQNLCEKFGLDFNHYTRGRTFDDFAARKVFGADYKAINSAMYQYTGSGWWQRQDEKRCEHMIAVSSEKVFKLRQINKWEWEETFPFSSESCANSALKYAMKRLYLEPPPNRHFRAFSNCTVDMRTGEMLPHDRSYYLTSAIDSEYVPNRPCPEVFLNFIISAFGEDQLDAVRAYTSMLLDPTAPYGKFVHIIGPSGSGKGTLLRLWGEIFGLEDSHSGDFSELANPESRHQHLTGKSLYTIPDTGGYITGIRPFYELVDNGKLSGRSLYSSCGYTKEWNCRFVAASVDHLQIENAGDGWDRRCLPLLSKGRQGLEDPYLRHKLSAAKADIVSWAMAMPREERDALLLQPSKNSRIRLAKLDAATYGDPVRSFVDLCLRPTDAANQIQNHELHSWFIAYCKAHGYSDNRGMSKFTSHLKTVIPQNHLPRHRQDGELTAATWTHITLLPSVMVDFSESAETSNGYQGTPNPHSEPDWRCAKFRCVEGGLLAFDEFWIDQASLGGITPDSSPTIALNSLGGQTIHSALIAQNTTQNQGLNGYQPNDQGITGGQTLHSALITLKTTEKQGFEGSDQGDQGDQGTTPPKNEGVGVVPSQQTTPPYKTEEELDSTLITPIASIDITGIHTEQGNEGISKADQGTSSSPDHPDHPDHPDRLERIGEWVVQLSEVAQKQGIRYEAVKELGVPESLRQQVFSALSPEVKDRLTELRKEFEGRIPEDTQRWSGIIETWSAEVGENTLNGQWQQFDLWSQCLLGIGDWVHSLKASGLFDRAASKYAQAIELALGTVAAQPLGVETNTESPIAPKQLDLLPDFIKPEPSADTDNRFSPDNENWL
jgi:phage/plasmid-associated DNA primase